MGSGDALKVQIGIDIFAPADAPISNRAFYEAVLHRIDRGADHRFAATEILRWQNPARKRGELRTWRQGNQADAWETLGPPIRAAILEAYPDLRLTT